MQEEDNNNLSELREESKADEVASKVNSEESESMGNRDSDDKMDLVGA